MPRRPYPEPRRVRKTKLFDMDAARDDDRMLKVGYSWMWRDSDLR